MTKLSTHSPQPDYYQTTYVAWYQPWIWDLLERLNPEYPTYRDLMRRGLIHEIEQGGIRVVCSEITAGRFFQIVLGEKGEK